VAKKIFALLMVAFMLVSAFGCTPAQPAGEQPTQAAAEPTKAAAEPTKAAAEPTKAAEQPPAEIVTLDYYIVGAGDTDQRELVEEAINAYVGPLIGANVVFHVVGWGDWASKSITGIQAGEKMDIFFTADWYYYMQLASEGLLRPLNDDNGEYGNLLEQYGQDILSSLNPAFITGTQIDGVNYAVPTNKELTVPMGYVYNLDVAEEIGFTPEDAAKIQTLADLEPWLAKAKEARPDEYPYLSDGSNGFDLWVPSFAAGVPAGIFSQLFSPDASGNFDETIQFIYDNEQVKEQLTILRDWYVKGYIHPDSGLSTFDTNPDMNAGKFFVRPMPLKGDNIKAQELINASGNADLRMGEIYGQPKVNVTTHAGGSMLAIPMLSEHPIEAMKFINLMHSDEKLVNMMLFGVEGTHWEVEADGRVNLINSAWYGAHAGAWTMGDIMLQKVTNKEDPEKNPMLIAYSDGSVDHPSLGFRFRTEPVQAELTALTAITDGTNRALWTGYIDPAVELPKYIEALKAAGLDVVRAEVEKQYAEWKKAKAGQ